MLLLIFLHQISFSMRGLVFIFLDLFFYDVLVAFLGLVLVLEKELVEYVRRKSFPSDLLFWFQLLRLDRLGENIWVKRKCQSRFLRVGFLNRFVVSQPLLHLVIYLIIFNSLDLLLILQTLSQPSLLILFNFVNFFLNIFL